MDTICSLHLILPYMVHKYISVKMYAEVCMTKNLFIQAIITVKIVQSVRLSNRSLYFT